MSTEPLTLEDLHLPTRVYNRLRQHGVRTVDDLLDWTWEDILSIKNLGINSLATVVTALSTHGLSLKGPPVPPWTCPICGSHVTK